MHIHFLAKCYINASLRFGNSSNETIKLVALLKTCIIEKNSLEFKHFLYTQCNVLQCRNLTTYIQPLSTNVTL